MSDYDDAIRREADKMGLPRIDDTAVVRRIASNKTHVAKVEAVRRATFSFSAEPRHRYWAPALRSITAACGVRIETTSVIMATGTKTRCRTCIHLTGMTEQPPTVHELLGAA